MVSSVVQVLGTSYSPYANRVQIALNLKSVDFEYIEQNLISKTDLLLRSNPVNKKVPVLIHGDKCISESLVIVQYIDETWSSNGHSFLPSDAYDRAIARFWPAYFDDKLVPLMRDLRSAQGEDKLALIERLEEGMVVLEKAFVKCSKGKAYFGGDNIGIIDIAVGSCLGWIKAMEKMNSFKLIHKDKTPGLTGWADTFMSNDAVKNVIPEPQVFIELLKKMQPMAKPASN
ncbi:Glutathione transferase [Heracleum sosnowskyi]|uniref:glutathione transferase n=1 Tax=Heracleum sosnowskyi TaxID=360622 RepID=A0AAD8HE50_9APIA|nr:Glutathione transferase [Heracleum sosnowskyi]